MVSCDTLKPRGGVANNEDGRITLLVLGVLVLALTLVLGAASVATVYVQHKQLVTITDSLATIGASALDPHQYYGSAGSVSFNLARQKAASKVRAASTDVFAGKRTLRDLHVSEVTLPRANQVQVSVKANARLKFFPRILPRVQLLVPLRVSSTANIVTAR
ncbi:MAG: hypothetical protein Q4A71_02985 [Actinomycetaceae bacterium]|nr:hypothetical protein [Actinomycetaceae bacterium]